MDNIDGKQARRTGTSSPLGELFEYVLTTGLMLYLANRSKPWSRFSELHTRKSVRNRSHGSWAYKDWGFHGFGTLSAYVFLHLGNLSYTYALSRLLQWTDRRLDPSLLGNANFCGVWTSSLEVPSCRHYRTRRSCQRRDSARCLGAHPAIHFLHRTFTCLHLQCCSGPASKESARTSSFP